MGGATDRITLQLEHRLARAQQTSRSCKPAALTPKQARAGHSSPQSCRPTCCRELAIARRTAAACGPGLTSRRGPGTGVKGTPTSSFG